MRTLTDDEIYIIRDALQYYYNVYLKDNNHVYLKDNNLPELSGWEQNVRKLLEEFDREVKR